MNIYNSALNNGSVVNKLATPALIKSNIGSVSFKYTSSLIAGAQYYAWYVNGQLEIITTSNIRVFTNKAPATNYTVECKVIGDGYIWSDFGSDTLTTSSIDPIQPLFFPPAHIVGTIIHDRTFLSYVGSGHDGYGNHQIASNKLPENQDGSIKWKMSGTTYKNAIVSFKTSILNENVYSNHFSAGAWASQFDNKIYVVDNGSISSTTYYGIPENHYKIDRTNGTFTLQTSADDITYTVLYTYGYSSDAEQYIIINLENGATVFNPIGTNLTTVNTYNSLSNAVIVCHGNSLTWGGSGTGVPYPTQLSGLSPFTTNGSVIYNKGRGGYQTQQLIDDASTYVDDLFDGTKLSVILSWEIGNDLFFNGDVTAAKARWVQYCVARRALGWQVISCTLTAREDSVIRPTYSGYSNSDFIDKINQINIWLRANWQNFCDGLLDFRADIRFQNPYDYTIYYNDNVHFIQAGNADLAEVAHDYLTTKYLP